MKRGGYEAKKLTNLSRVGEEERLVRQQGREERVVEVHEEVNVVDEVVDAPRKPHAREAPETPGPVDAIQLDRGLTTKMKTSLSPHI